MWTPDRHYYLFRSTLRSDTFGDIFALPTRAVEYASQAAPDADSIRQPELPKWVADVDQQYRRLPERCENLG